MWKAKKSEIDLTSYAEEMRQKPLTIHLCVPAKRIGKTHAKGILSRFYSVEGDLIPDENTGESEIPIPRLIPRLSLLADEVVPQKYCAFPLAKVGYKDETISISEYIPPTLTVPLNSPLGAMCSAMARKVREKAVFLAERLDAPSSAMNNPMILETKLLLRSIVASLPQFEAVFNTGVSHPYPLYLALCGMVGSMASLGAGMIPPVLSAYDHNDIRRTFEDAVNFVFRMMNEAVPESHTPVRFEYGRGIFSLKLEKEWTEQYLVVGVKAKPGVSQDRLLRWIDESLIGSINIIESVKERRILGAKRHRIDSEGELVPLRGTILLSVQTLPPDGAEQFIYPDQVLQIFNATDLAEDHIPSEIILYVKNKL
ncbi:MAG: type VI secretion system baseplate subunit TssK [Desulfobacteraceae bacterium]|nr:type VI secretion system baseplate subunit TssK [Desulfobacteraceae bacterium]